MSSESRPGPADPRVFAVGCPRSGTTLLQRILDAHPELAVANDTHFVPRCLEQHGAVAAALAGVEIRLTPALIERVTSYHRFRRLGLDDAAVDRAAGRARTYSAFVGALYEELAARHGKHYGGEKTPDYVRRMPLLHALFPSSRFVHIVRDGRDVVLSVLGWANENKGPGKLALWRDEPVAVAALWWRWQVRSGRRAAARLGPDTCLELRYESLVADPEPIARELFAFLGLPFDRRALAFHEGRVRHDPALSAKKAWLPPTPGLRDWRTEMSEPDVDLFESLSGDLLDELGMERTGRIATPEVARRAAVCRQWWNEEMERRAARDHAVGS